MAYKKKKRGRPRHQPQRPSGFLDSFTFEDVKHWNARSVDAQRYSNAVYFDLEKQRVSHHDALVSALRDAGGIELPITDWVRVTGNRWALQPLSSVGSIKGIGGRFNVGDALRLRAQVFPALYIAHDLDTAMYEYFGGPPASSALSMHELALRREGGFAVFVLEGQLENVLDIRDEKRLTAFVSIIKQFRLTKETQQLAKKCSLPPRMLMRSVKTLRDKLLDAPEAWRTEPQAASVPAPSQIFARYVEAAGYEGVLYPSQQGGTLCLALYPRNLKDSDSYIVVKGPLAPGTTYIRLDRDNLCIDGIIRA